MMVHVFDASRSLDPVRAACVAALALAAAAPACSQGAPMAVFVQGGRGENGVDVVAAGVQWPWSSWRRTALGGELTTHAEVFAATWRARDSGGRRANFLQVGLVPMLRWRPGAGRSPWFLEGGIGLSAMDERFDTPDKTFGSRLNFSDNLALGRSFGGQGRHEFSLRLQHTSNAGLKKPNPGLNLLALRYAVAL